jgi:GT2 family glycosyltransferase
MISVVCVFNNRQCLDRWLVSSLRRQTAQHELHLVDNTDGAFASAAEALNHGAKQASGDYIMFAHQDISLTTTDWLDTTESLISTLPSLGVAGVAGKVEKGPHTLSNIKHGDPPIYACDTRLSMPVKVQTLDECLAIIPEAVFRRHRFDKDLCPDWHLYIVEYCLRLKCEGFEVYVIPQPLYHEGASIGTPLPEGYYSTLERILPAFRDRYRYVATMCGDWDTRIPVRGQR